MWVTTNFGFFSVVQKPSDQAANTLTVRARVRADLEALAKGFLPALGEISEDTGTDYRFRATAPREAVAVALLNAVLAIDYNNFKASVGAKQGSQREEIYHKVWTVLAQLADGGKHGQAGLRSLSSKQSAAGPTAIKQKTAYGGVLFDEDGRVLLREVAGHFDNTVWTFAKGKPSKGDTSAEAVALREVLEETGYQAEILAPIPGTFQGSTSANEYFLMRPVGAQGKWDSETECTKWVTPVEAPAFIEETTKRSAKERDLQVLAVALAMWNARPS